MASTGSKILAIDTYITEEYVISLLPFNKTHRTSIEYKKDNKTVKEYFISGNYGGHNFADIIKTRFKLSI